MNNLKLDQEKIKDLYLNKLYTIREIAENFHVHKEKISACLHFLGIVRNPSERLIFQYQRGRKPTRLRREQHWAWRGGRIQGSNGHILIHMPDYHRAGKNGYVFEHIVVWEKFHNKKLLKGWVIHHLNGIKTDNRPRNLVALSSQKHFLVLEAKAKRIQELEAMLKQQGQII